MSNGTPPTRDALDDKANQLFAGKVVRKDLVRKVKVGANVPVFVLEFLLGKYCASSDELAIQMGLQVVNDTLANNYIRPDESAKAQSKVKENGKYSFIDKVKVRLGRFRLLGGGCQFQQQIPAHPQPICARLRAPSHGRRLGASSTCASNTTKRRRARIRSGSTNLTPIQIATFDLDEYRNVRRQFTTDEWIDLIVRSMGYEPGEMSRRLKLLFLVRLIPLAERNYNLVELGPRGTGKSYVVQEVSPYTALLTGGTTVANLFGHMSGRQKGMVQIWDVVGFDEVADLQKMPKEVITTMKTYCESGTFQRGQEAVAGDASIAMFGNTNQPIDVMVQTGHLFAPMPDIIRDDMAFIDRLHFYLPGWEIPQMRNELFTDHYGFVVDYLAEALREMRKHNFTEIIDRHFSMGAHLNARDRKAVRKTVSGLMKILFPHGEVTQEELAEILEFALEGRRRVKEQLKKMGSFEYYQTSFSYTLQETGEEKFVGVPEQGGRDLISTDPLSPGTVYTAGVTSDGTVGLYRLEVSVSSGTGKLKMAGGISGAMKESVQRAFSYVQAKKSELGIARDLETSDLHVEVIDLLGNRVEAEIGVAFFVASYSALRKAPVSPALLVLGDMSVQGNIKPLRSLTEPLQVAKDNGAKRALIPIENKRNFLDVSADIMEHVDPVFYGDPRRQP